MKQIECPKCGEKFNIDKNLCDEIVEKVRNFDKLVNDYNSEIAEKDFKINVVLLTKIEDIEQNKRLSEKRKAKQIAELKIEMANLEKEKEELIIKRNNLNLEF